MKKRHILLFGITVIIVSLLRPGVFAEAQSYVLALRGGGNMTATYARVSGETVVNITFERSPYADNRSHPGPGQVAWIDRPLTPEEHLLLQYKHKNNRISVLAIKSGEILVEKYDGSSGGQDLRYLLEGIREGKLFYVHATRAKLPWGSDYLKITRIGP